jgi:hypothetical protein
VICSDCKRRLNKPTLTIGDANFGPVCAGRYLVRKKRQAKAERRGTTKVPARDPHTRDWINEAAMAA